MVQGMIDGENTSSRNRGVKSRINKVLAIFSTVAILYLFVGFSKTSPRVVMHSSFHPPNPMARGFTTRSNTTYLLELPLKTIHENSEFTNYSINHYSTIATNLSQKRNACAESKKYIRPASLKNGTDPRYTFYSIVNNKPNYTICDTIEINIQVRNSANKSKSCGGDYIWVWVYSKTLRASATADEIIDNQDGSYTVKIKPRWSGKTRIGVSLVHSSETVSLLRYFRETYPARYSYSGTFKSGKQKKTTTCHVSPAMYVPVKGRYDNMTFCNYTDAKTGFPWFCVKPVNISCDAYFQHSSGGSADEFHRTLMSKKEMKLYVRPSPVRPRDPSQEEIVVLSEDRRTLTSTCSPNQLPQCKLELPQQHDYVSGFYYNDTWTSLVCKNRHFQAIDIKRCLQNKTVHFIGDSTVRQWYEYLTSMLNGTVQEHKGSHEKFGPHQAIDKLYNISLYFTFHGYPIALRDLSISKIKYVPDQLDSYQSLENDIICLCLWAHFTGTNLQYYKNRLRSIKDAILGLKMRNPNISVLIKSANTRSYSQDFDRSNWYAWEVDKVMREMMSGFPWVTIIDVWHMTIGHRTGYNLHPGKEIISQEIDMFLSYICPAR